MRYEFKPSFEDPIKKLSSEEKENIKLVAIQTIDILSQSTLVKKGMGLKRLKDDFWEIRCGIKMRIIFRWSGDLIEFILAGSHDKIKIYLKT